MTITRWGGFAIIPKRCTVCNRLFWLEPFDVYYKDVWVGIGHYSAKHIMCKECDKKMDEVSNGRV